MGERNQVNMAFGANDPTYQTLIKTAERFKIEPTKAARIFLIQRAILDEAGWKIEDQRRFDLFRVIGHLNDKGLDKVETFIAQTFSKEFSTQLNSRPAPLVLV